MSLLAAGVLLILGGGVSACIWRRHPHLADAAFRTLVLVGCGVVAVPAVRALAGGPEIAASLSSTLPGGAWVVGLDRLSAWFVLLLCIVSAGTAAYGTTYLAAERPHRDVAAAHAMFALLVAAMVGVFIARAAVPFLVSWELMALSAYLAIVFDHEHPAVCRAGMVYLILTHAGTLGLLGMFLLWGRATGDLSFGSMTPAAAHAVAGGAPILLLAFFGFGMKAGAFPFHFWLPGAHASAPSHVSALLSGVMIKTGIYGLLRVIMLFGPVPAWWGWMILLLGLASAVLGVLWALTQRDVKRALAYSSVDNIGVILLGLGLGALGTAYHQPTVAILGFTAALLHSMNHALFKSLLFLAAGVVARATHTREIDRLGGLFRAMPRTAWAFLVGSIAIIGLPPLNGFIGEWTLVRGFLAAGALAGPVRIAVLAAAAVGLIGALTLACFTRLYATIFLGTPRAGIRPVGNDAPGGMGFGLGLLGAACLAIGIVPALVVSPALQVAALLATGAAGTTTDASTGAAALTLPIVAFSLGGLGLMLALIRSANANGRTLRLAPTWGCAYRSRTERMQYTGASFSDPLTQAYSFASSRASGAGRRDAVLQGMTGPVWQHVSQLALRLRPLQQGRVTTYLQYMIATVIVMLGFLFFAGSGTQP